ncbi:MAG TPA: hypothetical protein DCP91_09605 [Eggerthellaceae bacterium]|nr:hypothetical protein [Eggerthellaceae bacterium]
MFFDESGQERRYRPDTKYYLLTLVLHNQKDPISGLVESYERSLSESSLPNVPFHAYDLYHRRGGYAGLDFGTRKKLFAKFAGLVRRLPVTYTTFKYRRSEFEDAKALSERMERDLVAFVKEHLAEFQSFDTVATYYDGGQMRCAQPFATPLTRRFPSIRLSTRASAIRIDDSPRQPTTSAP